MSDKKPNLGLATTKELIDELAARADVATAIKEAWPSYKTVFEEPTPVPPDHPKSAPTMHPSLMPAGSELKTPDGLVWLVVDWGNGHEWTLK